MGDHKKPLTFRERKAKTIVNLQDLNIVAGVRSIKRKYKRNPEYTMIQDIIYLLQNLREKQKRKPMSI